ASRPCSNTVALAATETVRPIFSSASNSSGSRELQTLWPLMSQSAQSREAAGAALCEQDRLRTLASTRPKTVSTKVFSAKLSKTNSRWRRTRRPLSDNSHTYIARKAERRKILIRINDKAKKLFLVSH